MKMAKRMMAALLCLAMLLSGFALAETETAPAQEQELIQDEANPEADEGHSEISAVTGDADGEVDAAASADGGEDGADEPDADQNDSEQGEDVASSETGEAEEDGDADVPETSDGENAPETLPEPGVENGETETDEDDATGEFGETEEANADINLLSKEPDADLGAPRDSGCQHANEQQTEEWDEPAGKPNQNLGEKGHEVYFIHHTKITCLECGEVLVNREEETSKIFEHNLTASDGVFKCDDCEYSFACKHEYKTTETIIEPADDLEGYVVSSDASGHTIKVREWKQSHCEKCDYRWDKEDEKLTEVSEAHEWDEKNGGKVCRKCGYKNSCTHENVDYVDEWNDIVRATKINGDEHSAVYALYGNVKCADCGLIVKRDAEIYRWTQTEDHRFEELSDGTVGCTDCGYVIPCAHPDVEFLVKENVGYKEPQQVDADYHMVRRYDQIHYRCRDCGHEWGWEYPDYEEREPVKERHIWNDEGICKICGYKSECTEHNFEPVPGSERDGTYDYKCLDAYTHEITLGVFHELACTKCGYTIDEFVEGSAYEPIVEEHCWSPEGYCEVCGVKGFCQHPAAYVEKLTGTVSRDDLDPIDSDEKTHTVYTDKYVEYHCKRCDTWWGYEVIQYGIPQTEPHSWDSDNGSRCVICGHANKCTHVGTTEDFKEDNFRVIQSMTTATTHSLDTYVIKGTRCTNCGAEFNLEYLDELDEIVTEPHKFVRQGGKTVCEVCGYIKPEKQTESTEKKTEETVFERIADGTVVHGVTVGQPTRMGVTMVQAMAGIMTEYGADTAIEIQNIDKVLTADECAALKALQPTERILVALSAIGYGDEVKNALTELQLTLSEEARVLNLKVNTRVALMDDAAKAAHQKAIEQYFPNANGASVTLKIRKAGESGARLERYGFAQSNGEWVFAKLEVAKA